MTVTAYTFNQCDFGAWSNKMHSADLLCEAVLHAPRVTLTQIFHAPASRVVKAITVVQRSLSVRTWSMAAQLEPRGIWSNGRSILMAPATDIYPLDHRSARRIGCEVQSSILIILLCAYPTASLLCNHIGIRCAHMIGTKYKCWTPRLRLLYPVGIALWGVPPVSNKDVIT